ncbi:hypothetical protein [Mycolicibacterium wolinskyi]|uniref:hypothetical protein n=1 Tax=Mycolicibacterium wolinskyi TaxID=59750 RepID=UPI003917AE72
MNGSPRPVPSDGLTPDLLAELQAGLLDDATAARVRQQVRSDPDAAATLAALDRVRRDVAALGTDEASAPAVPPDVSARMIAALRAAGGRAGGDRSRGRWRRIGAITGCCAALLGAGVGAATLTQTSDTADSSPTSLGRMTVAPPPADIGLSEPEILGLLSAPPDLGPLADPQRRAQCLSALGYPSGVRVLGARPHAVSGRPGVLVLLPADTPNAVVGLVVTPDCDAAHTELLADTVVKRP